MFARCGCHFIPKRFLVTALAFVGCFSMYNLRSTLGIAIVEMTSDKMVTVSNRTENIRAERDWNSVQKGYILSAFAFGNFWTFTCSCVAVKLGGVTTFGLVMALNGIISILLPTFMRINLYLFLIGRAMQGLLLGVGTIGVVDTFYHWSPPEERVRLTSYYFMGTFSGIALSYPLFGFITHRYGWQAIFYISGGFALLWCSVWLMFVANDPAVDKYISEEERMYLKKKIKHLSMEQEAIPWRKILKSGPVCAFINEYFTICWCASFLFFCIPLYIKDMYNVDIQQIGFLGGIPMACSAIMIPLSAYVADYLRSNVFSIPKVHNIFLFFGNLSAMLLLVAIAFGKSFLWSMICFCLIRIVVTFPETSYAALPIDMAGRFSSVIKAMSLSAGGLAHFLNPIVIGYLVPNHTRSEWNLYFLFLSFISLYGVVMFYIFGSGELQSWATPKNMEKTKDGEKSKKVSVFEKF